MKDFTTTEVRNLLNQVMREDISFSEMVEIMNERVSGRVEEIPVRKFKKGDKVRIKEGVSSKTHCYFPTPMDDFIGKTMTVGWYTHHEAGYVVCDESGFLFREDWLEPYEELKKGDLAIFWDGVKRNAIIRMYYRLNEGVEYHRHQDIQGLNWDNAIKLESKEQYERLIKGEI